MQSIKQSACSVARCCPPQPAVKTNHTVRKVTHLTNRMQGSTAALRAQSQPAAAVAEQAATAYVPLWEQFGTKAPGEWEGVTATFNGRGEAQQLPQHNVPEAFREWGVEIYDWQSTCSTWLADDGSHSMHRSVKRMMPTVGCEADAIAFTDEVADVWQATHGGTIRPVAGNGSYVAVPEQLGGSSGAPDQLELCLASQDGLNRVRVMLTLGKGSDQQVTISQLELHNERWDTPYHGRAELSGCGGGGKPFAKTEVLKAEQLVGSWQAVEALQYDAGASGQLQLSDTRPDWLSSVGTEGPQVLLPLGVWVQTRGQGERLNLEAGVLRGPSERHVATCRYHQGRLQQVCIGTEAKSS